MLRPILEVIHIVYWLFELFDVESRCNIHCKLEGLNKVSLDVHVMLLAKSNLESKKHMRDSVDQKAHFV
jgi:hypothetical protein